MKVALTGLFAASLIVVTSAADAGSILDTVIANARSHFDDCQINRNGVSCKKQRVWVRKPSGAGQYETSSAKSTVVIESGNSSIPNTTRSLGPVGQWIVDDGDRRVQIKQCGKSLCGIISYASPGAIDRNNPDPEQRNRPLVSVPVLMGMTQTEANRWEGQIYNTRDGRTYSGKISLRSANLLVVEGNAPHALLLQTWIKDDEDTQ
jgi:uncharacterized protein (DUF2147 family)